MWGSVNAAMSQIFIGIPIQPFCQSSLALYEKVKSKNYLNK